MNGLSNGRHVFLATALVEADRRRADEWRRRRSHERPVELERRSERETATDGRATRVGPVLRLRRLFLGLA